MSRPFWILLSLVAVGCSGSEKPPIVLAHVYNAGSAGGKDAVAGIELALAELAGAPIAQGRTLIVRHSDSKGSLEWMESHAVREAALLRAGIVLGGTTPEEAHALEKARVPLLTFSGSRGKGEGSVFCTGLSPTFRARCLVRYLTEERKLKNIVLLADERRTDRAEIEAEVKPASTILWKKDDKLEDATASAWDKSSAPRAWMFVGSPEDFVRMRKTAKRPDVWLYAGDEFSWQGVEADPETLAASVFGASAEAPRAEAFGAKYQEKYKSPPSPLAALAYDDVMMIAHVLKGMTSSLQGEKFREELEKLKDYEGLTGSYAFQGPQIQRPAFVGRLADGKLEAVKRYVP